MVSYAVLVTSLLLQPTEDPAPRPPVAPASQMQEPQWVSHDSPEGKTWIEGVAQVLAEQLSPLDRRRLGTKVLSPARVSLAQGTFPQEGTVLVIVNVPLRAAEPETAPKSITGMFTLKSDGTLATIIIEPKMRPVRLELRAVGRHDADGHEDFEYEESTELALIRHRVTWPDGKPHDETLSSVPVPQPPSPAE